MKKGITIFFLLIFTLTQTPAGQLLKLPLLIEHYNNHNKRDGFSLVQFLQGHYKAPHNDADRSEDEELPFRSIVFQEIGSALVPTGSITNLSVDYPTIPKKELIESFTEQLHLFSIFRPPRA